MSGAISKDRTHSQLRVFLVRHGQVDKIGNRYDELNEQGKLFSNELPNIFDELNISIVEKFFDVGEGEIDRCKNTVVNVGCQFEHPYGAREKFRNINAVLRYISKKVYGDFLVCYCSESIESGDLYHVENFDLHTNFHDTDYESRVRNVMAQGYTYIYQLERSSVEFGWKQVSAIPISVERGYQAETG